MNRPMARGFRPVLKAFTVSLLVAGAAYFATLDAQAVPGLSSSESVKSIVDMIKVYAERDQRVNAYDLEKKLRDRPRAATDALVDLLDTNNTKVQYETANVLNRLSVHADYSISDESLKTLMAILKASKDPTVKASLLAVLGNIGPKNQEVKQTILGVIEGDHEVATKKAAIQALAKLSKQEKPEFHIQSTEVLVEILKNDDAPSLRREAAVALSRYHNDEKIAVPALILAMDDNYLSVRTAAVQALGYYKSSASEAIPVLLKALDSEPDTSIKSGCIYALRMIGKNDQRVADKFVELLDDPTVSRNVINYLYDFGDRAVAAVPKLVKLLASADLQDRRYACRALGAIGTKAKEALPALKKSVKDSDSYVRRYAQTAINQIENKSPASGSM